MRSSSFCTGADAIAAVKAAIAEAERLTLRAALTRSCVVRPTAPGEQSSSPANADVDGLLATLQHTIDTADTDGGLDHDQAKDLSRRVERIQRAWADGDLDEFRDQCQQLRDDLDQGDRHGDKHGDGDGDGGIDTTVAQTIDATIDELLAAGAGQ